ncbi:ABC transporter permease [Niabella sp. CC-SYL272]|uniref:ABC transporter permease n=1 Tax=Niabella agricola TaxID=2891571 RepID=UPI001F32ECC7|nr:ABC transporter permease [Niabella agricola]MCF3107470.1 ABC transporter permease [Niabella agricola]
MIKNYIRTAWRNLVKSKVFAVTNIMGLSIGMAVSMLIAVWIWNELSYNKQINNYQRIARVMQHKTNKGVIQTGIQTPYPLGDALRQEYGDLFQQVVVGTGIYGHPVKAGEKQLDLSGGFFEPGAGALLGLKMIDGVQNGLEDVNSIMLSASSARSVFGTTAAVGKAITLDKDLVVKVTGVYEDLSKNSDFGALLFIAPWQLFLRHTDWIRTAEDPWRPNAFVTYVLLNKGQDIQKVSRQIKDVRLKHVNARLAIQKPELFLHPMERWYLYDSFKNGVNTGGRIQYVWMFGIIGVFVLLLACINFMNLSTARSIKRAREVGIRKTIGSFRKQLIVQFFCESLLYAVLAFGISLVLVALAMPLFNAIAGKQLPPVWKEPLFWAGGVFFCLLTGMLAGIYPAFYLSSFRPVKVLKGTFKAGRSSAMQRQVLVVVQFTISIMLIIGTIVVFNQIRYTKDRPIGYDRNGLVIIDVNTSGIHDHLDVIKRQLQQQGNIVSVAETNGSVSGDFSTTTGIDWPGKEDGTSAEFPFLGVGYDFGKTINWQVVAGRDFSRDFPSDSAGVILNEAAVKYMGLKQPIGTVIYADKAPITIIGVVKNMIMESPFASERPALFYFDKNAGGYLMARINPAASASAAIAQLQSVFKTYVPDQPFHYQFVDDAFNQKFGDEERLGTLGGGFALLAIFISCLGLFGMASFMAEQRVKEIGVRKVLGASVPGLWRLLSQDFIRLVFLALVIAIPAGWYCMHNWLQHYSYRVSISWEVFVIAASGAVLIALITVSFQAIKAAVANPVRALRSE